MKERKVQLKIVAAISFLNFSIHRLFLSLPYQEAAAFWIFQDSPFIVGWIGKGGFSAVRSRPARRSYLRSKVLKMKEWIKDHRMEPVGALIKKVNLKLIGHYQYYGVTDNLYEMRNFQYITKWLLFNWLNRRSQRRSYTLDDFYNGLLRTFPIAEPRIWVSLLYCGYMNVK